jgi:hypothetical protein
MADLAAWDSFYVIVGAAAGALIGLQFVVVTLIAQRPTRTSPEGSSAFGTPTVVHFGTALLLSALARVPWQSISPAATLLVAIGVCGVIYSLNVIRRMRTQGVYEPEFEDWLCHVVLPVIAYATLALSAVAALSHTRQSLFGIGAAVLLLLFIGIHNAWDAVVYHVYFSASGNTDGDQRPSC